MSVDEPPRRRGRAAASRLRVALALGVAMVATALAFTLVGCRSARNRGSGDVVVLQPAPIPTPVIPPPIATPEATPPLPPAIESDLEIGDRAFDAGDYDGARAAYQTHLAGPDAGIDADRVLYRLAVLDLAKDAGGRDSAAGYTLLRRLVREHPDSPYRIEAELILGLSARADGLATEVEKLGRQLEALKRIDLERSQERRSP